MLRKSFFLFLGSSLLIVACESNKKEATATQSDSVSTSPSQQSSNANKPALSNIKVTIKNGEMAGTYDAVCRDGCTSYGIAGEKVLGNQYSETGKGPKELSSVQLVVNDVSGDKQTKNFTLTVGFGDLLGQMVTYNINTNNGTTNDGSGSADIKYSNDKANIHVTGTTKGGIGLDVVIDAAKVLTTSNMAQ